MDEAAL